MSVVGPNGWVIGPSAWPHPGIELRKLDARAARDLRDQLLGLLVRPSGLLGEGTNGLDLRIDHLSPARHRGDLLGPGREALEQRVLGADGFGQRAKLVMLRCERVALVAEAPPDLAKLEDEIPLLFRERREAVEMHDHVEDRSTRKQHLQRTASRGAVGVLGDALEDLAPRVGPRPRLRDPQDRVFLLLLEGIDARDQELALGGGEATPGFDALHQ